MRIAAYLLFLLFMVATYAAIRPAAGSGLASYAVVLVLSFVSTAVHELAHAAAAWRFGARITEIMVFPLRYRPARRRIELTGRMEGGEVGGFVRYSLDRVGARSKHGWIAAAGPAANLALAAILFLVCAMLTDRAQWQGGAAQGRLPSDAAVRTAIGHMWFAATLVPYLSGLAILSLGAGVVNLLPFDGSDGAAILRALRNRRR